jgi:hypothetical protein
MARLHRSSMALGGNLNGSLETRTVALQAATTALLVASLPSGCVLCGIDGRTSLFCVLGQSRASHVKFFFKVAVIILVRGNNMLSLLKVCESCIE